MCQLFMCDVFCFFQGVIEDRIGFFPAAFAHQVRAGDQVFRCTRTFIGCKEQGQITLKEGQVLYKPYDDDNDDDGVLTFLRACVVL